MANITSPERSGHHSGVTIQPGANVVGPADGAGGRAFGRTVQDIR
jgi:hypothetical protein